MWDNPLFAENGKKVPDVFSKEPSLDFLFLTPFVKSKRPEITKTPVHTVLGKPDIVPVTIDQNESKETSADFNDTHIMDIPSDLPFM